MNSSQRLDTTFAALADPTRRAILARLASGEASVTELVKPFAISQPAISKHLKVLERAGVVRRPDLLPELELDLPSCYTAGSRSHETGPVFRLSAS